MFLIKYGTKTVAYLCVKVCHDPLASYDKRYLDMYCWCSNNFFLQSWSWQDDSSFARFFKILNDMTGCIKFGLPVNIHCLTDLNFRRKKAA